jgi:glycosyltransferase involved in cell wall biosynthesis
VSNDILIGCYGAARAEKGSDLFQAAARQFLEKYPATKVRFAMQWLDDFKDENDLWVRKDNFLTAHPRFEYISRLFDPDGEYLRQVQKTDLMVLPYRDSYRYRLSRVVIESILAGVPVVVSRDTTLCEQASEFGAAIRVEMNSVNSLLMGIEKAVANIHELKTQAEKARSIATVHFSVASFRNLLS